jgi:hypothetical protein
MTMEEEWRRAEVFRAARVALKDENMGSAREDAIGQKSDR